MQVETIGVVGCGQMGSGIAQVCITAGYPVTVLESSRELLDRGLGRIAGRLQREIARGRMSAEACDAALARLQGTLRSADLAACDLVVEAVAEDRALKRRVFADLDAVLKPEALLVTNTSSLSVIELAAATNRRQLVAGMHFFNPVPAMPLVELVRTIATAEETITTLRAVAGRLGKTVVLAKDSPGFIVNLLLVPYLLDAIRALEHGVATRDDIDTGMKLGCGLPMGPLTLADFIGLDTLLAIADALLFDYQQERYAAPPLLRRMVTAGLQGKKSGEGFYRY